MVDENTENLNNTSIEGPGGTQATHEASVESTSGSGSSAGRSSPRGRVADKVDQLGDTLERRALEMELQGGVQAKAAPVFRRVSRAADVGANYVRETSVGDMRVDLESEIREHPLKSLAIALGCGYLLAKILD